MTTPSAPIRLTSAASCCRASWRASLTSSVQPLTSALPAHQRVWPTVRQSSCLAAIEMPSASPAGIQPLCTSLAKSWPDRSEVNGWRSGGAPGARIAVPIALNSSPPAGNRPMVSATPTTPCPPSSAHSATIRLIAARLASYIVCTIGPNDPYPPLLDTWVRAAGPQPSGVVAAPRARAAVAADVADVVDRGAEHLADGLEADRADRGELIRGERRPPGAAAPDLGHPGFRYWWQVVAHGP